MLKIHLANILLICVLGTLMLWPNIIEPRNYPSINTAYNSVCMIETSDYCASGVLLESGYVLTASHVVDRNKNGKLENEEEVLFLTFSNADDFVTKADVVTFAHAEILDIAILKPRIPVPLPGVKMIPSREYYGLKTGTPIYTIGMPNGSYPANITDGRIIDIYGSVNEHRNSANSYMGNSGGGVFYDDVLIGISSKVGIGELGLDIPIFENREKVGMQNVWYTVPLANVSTHVPVPAIRAFLNRSLKDSLVETPIGYPYGEYYAAIGFNLGLIFILLAVFKVMRRYMDR